MHNRLPEKDYNLISFLLKAKETDLFKFCQAFLNKYYGKHNIYNAGQDFIYATGDLPVLLTAHLDTVLSAPPTSLLISADHRRIMSNQGLGADDRAGVYAILKIIKSGRRPSVLFTTGEEWGGIGALSFVSSYPSPLVPTKYIIEIDRRGRGQAVYYNCQNPQFEKYISSFGFTTQKGIFSDISIICPEWNIAGVNLSAGYYNEHTAYELLKMEDLNYTIEQVKALLDDSMAAQSYDFDPLAKLSNVYIACQMCHSQVPIYNAYKIEDTIICGDCVEKYVGWCEQCDRPFIYGEETQNLCKECSADAILKH